MDIDVNAERERLIRIWQDTLSLVESIVENAKLGQRELRASMLQQINSHLKLSAEILQTLQSEERQGRIRSQYEETGDDTQEEPAGVVPFPIQEEPLKVQ